MAAMTTREPGITENGATVDRPSDCELVVSRTMNGPAAIVYQAWTRPELFERWWVPKSYPITLLACAMDVRVGGEYRLTFGFEGSTSDFFGRYVEVTPPQRLVWTNDEGDAGQTITTVTFEETDGATKVVVHDRYPSREALDEALTSGSACMPEQLQQLADVLGTQDATGEPA